MKRGIEELYAKINNKFLVLGGFFDNPLMGSMFRMCRLKPYDISSNAPKFIKHWIDEFGNSLHIEKKNIRIVLNDLSIDTNKTRTTDLYGGLSISKIAKISKTAFISQNLLAFIGIDDYLRTFIFIDNKWKKCSPLLLGMEILETIADNIDMTYSREMKINSHNLLIMNDKYWLTTMPISENLIDEFALQGVIDG